MTSLKGFLNLPYTLIFYDKKKKNRLVNPLGELSEKGIKNLESA